MRGMKKHFAVFFTLAGLAVSSNSTAIDGIYLGVQGGHVGVPGPIYMSGLGAGADVGFVVSPVIDMVFRTQLSSHDGGGGMTLWSNTISADFHLGNFYDVDIALGGGPGLYKYGPSSLFGLHGELNTDVAFGNGLRAGLGWRYHGVFSPGAGQGSYWSVMARFGYLIEM
jgi:hypothetical protein